MSEIEIVDLPGRRALRAFPNADRTAMMKRCTKCREIKLASRMFFTRDEKGILGLASRCLRCMGESNQAAMRAKREARDEWRRLNAAQIEAEKSAKKAASALATKLRRAEYRKENPIREKMANLRKRAAKPEVYKAIQRRHAEKIKNEPRMRLRNTINARMSGLAKGAKSGRKWNEMMGYTYDDLRKHLERQFTKKMSWDNYGSVWHIDHIIALSSFDFIGDYLASIKACWALSNLRPLYAKENCTKGNKRLFLV